jgi:hypothetical protein
VSESKHTPGPWRVGADLCRVHPHWMEGGCLSNEALHRNGYAKTIATVANENHDWRDIGAQVADAYLIAAAPEMFDILEEMLPGTLCGESHDPPLPENEVIRTSYMTWGQLRRARALLAKARGES